MTVQTAKNKNTKKCRGRPISFDKEQLIETVMHQFWEKGYKGLSLNEIAQETGLTRASLYNSFGSKDALFLEAIQYYFKQAPDAFLEDITEGQSISDAFFKLFEDVCKERAADEKARGCLTVNCLNELISSETAVAQELQEMLSAKRQGLEKLIQQAVQQKELPADTDTSTTANLFITFMCGFSTFSKMSSEKQELLSLCYNFLDKIGFKRSI